MSKQKVITCGGRADIIEWQGEDLIVRVAELQRCLNSQPKHFCYVKLRNLIGKTWGLKTRTGAR